MQMLSPSEIAKIAVKVLDDKKALDIKLLKTTDVTILADYFIICTATSSTHMRSLGDYVEHELKNVNEPVLRREGELNNDWMLIDFGCLVVHIFLQDCRDYYKLEHLWSDAENIDITNYVKDGL